MIGKITKEELMNAEVSGKVLSMRALGSEDIWETKPIHADFDFDHFEYRIKNTQAISYVA